MFGKFFDTSAIDDFAAQVVADLAKTLPPDQCESQSKSARKGRDDADGRIRRHVEAFAADRPLNVYQKAKLGIRVQEALEGAGYPATFAKSFAYDLVSRVATLATRKV